MTRQSITNHLSFMALYEGHRNKVLSLHPEVRKKFIDLHLAMEEKGMPIHLVESFRSARRQSKLYAIGRGDDDRTIVTNARGLESYHQYGLAFDVNFKGHGWNPPSDNWWATLGEEGKKVGLKWGGDWEFYDPAHFEYHPGITWQQLKDFYQNEQNIRAGLMEAAIWYAKNAIELAKRLINKK